MSTFYTRQVSCPHCCIPVDAWLARGVHANRRTDLRDEILSRTFHRRSCDQCGTRFEVAQQLVYTDFDLKHWIYVATDADRPGWPAWEARLFGNFAQVFSRHSPLVDEFGDGMRCRLVFGYEELREKLVVWEAGFDDAIVECMKARAIATEPALGTRLIIDRIDADNRFHLRGGHEFPPVWTKDADRDRNSLRQRFPELFGGGYVNVARFMAHPGRAADHI